MTVPTACTSAPVVTLAFTADPNLDFILWLVLLAYVVPAVTSTCLLHRARPGARRY